MGMKNCKCMVHQISTHYATHHACDAVPNSPKIQCIVHMIKCQEHHLVPDLIAQNGLSATCKGPRKPLQLLLFVLGVYAV